MKTLAALVVAVSAAFAGDTSSGVASWYGWDHQGKLTASGEAFDCRKLTCASWRYPIGTVLRVTYGGRSVTVRVNDRGPARRLGREIDLSLAAFERLADPSVGLIRVTVKRVRRRKRFAPYTKPPGDVRRLRRITSDHQEPALGHVQNQQPAAASRARRHVLWPDTPDLKPWPYQRSGLRRLRSQRADRGCRRNRAAMVDAADRSGRSNPRQRNLPGNFTLQ